MVCNSGFWKLPEEERAGRLGVVHAVRANGHSSRIWDLLSLWASEPWPSSPKLRVYWGCSKILRCANRELFHDLRMSRIKNRHKIVLFAVQSFYETSWIWDFNSPLIFYKTV